MDWLTLLSALGVSNILSILITWKLGGKRTSDATNTLTEIEGLFRMREFYRDEVDRLTAANKELNATVDQLLKELREVRAEAAKCSHIS